MAVSVALSTTYGATNLGAVTVLTIPETAAKGLHVVAPIAPVALSAMLDAPAAAAAATSDRDACKDGDVFCNLLGKRKADPDGKLLDSARK